MSPDDAFQQAAQAYVDGVRVLFAPAGIQAGDRGGVGPVSYETLAGQAESLLLASAEVVEAGAQRLVASPYDTETTLLAKALADLEVSGYLLRAARDEEAARELDQLAPPGTDPGPVLRALDTAESGPAAARAVEPFLLILLGAAPPVALAVDRAAAAPPTIADARVRLKSESDAALALISRRSLATGKLALEGLLSLGMRQIARAAGLVGLDIAEALGVAEKVTRLYEAFRGFLTNAYNTVLALLGPGLAKAVTDEVVKWVEQINVGASFASLLETLYRTEQTRELLEPIIESSGVELAEFVAALGSVSEIGERFRKQTSLADKVLPKISYVAVVPASILPYGPLFQAAIYLAIAGYVVFLGADYVDAPRARLLNRVPGIRQTIETHLAAPAEEV